MAEGTILIVGAGPTGLTAALVLAENGTPVRLVDRLPAPTNQSRAAIVHARTMEMLERLGVLEDFLAVGARVHGASIYDSNGRLLAHPTLDHLPTAYPFMLGLEQSVTETLLARRLRRLGVEVERNTELLELAEGPAGVDVRLRTATGSEETAQYAFVVGADGAHSTVRHALGLPMEGETLDTTWITADVRIGWDRLPDEAVTYLSKEGFAFIAPMNGDRWRVIVNVSQLTPEQAQTVTLADVQAIVRERFGISAPLSDPVWIAPFRINTRLCPAMRRGRVFLAGDAAHVHSPIGGQGMNTGMQDAWNLAWKIALVRAGRARPELLESYEAERHTNARRLLATVGPATKLVGLRHPVAIEVRNFALHVMSHLGATAQTARTFSMLEVGYPHSPVVEDHARLLDHGPHAGERAPDAVGMLDAEREPRRLFELWAGDPRHQLLVFSGASGNPRRSDELRAMGSEIAAARADLLATHFIDRAVDPDGTALAAYGVEDEGCFLVRPDGCIAFRASPVRRELLEAYLDRWFLPSPSRRYS